MRLQLVDVLRQLGSHVVLDGVGLSSTRARGSGSSARTAPGKSTLLRILAGLEEPDAGRVVREPATLTVGYLPQEHGAAPGETLLELLARRTGVAAAERELAAAARASPTAPPPGALRPRARALPRARRRRSRAPRGRRRSRASGSRRLERPTEALSGGEAARLALAAILLSRFDVLLLDEPTNDLDFDGLERLERFLATTPSALVVVSHDRAFLDRTVTRIVEIEPGRGRVRE